MEMKKTLIMALAVCGLAYAGSTTDNPTITATVSPYCEIQNPLNDVNVDYNPYETVMIDVGSLDFGCVKGTDFTISATSGNNPSGPNGVMLKTDDPTQQITYSLSASVNYGSISSHSSNLFANPISMTAPTMDPPVSFYVAITFGGQPAPVGHYSDTVTINISY